MLKAEFLQAAQVTVYDYYEPSRRCTSFYNLPTEHASLRKICDKDVCRCAEEQCPSPKKDSNHLSQEELQTAACEAGVDFVYKASLESVETSDSNPYIYYNMKLQAIIKSDTSMSWARRRFSCTGQRMGQWARRNCWTNWQGFQTICTPMAASPETLRVSAAHRRVSPSAPEPPGLNLK
ncbi:complement C3-like isoform X2 [Bubalus kerabau]|nr:complement C3-like isoform X2 [Bubalus carabanensis]